MVATNRPALTFDNRGHVLGDDSSDDVGTPDNPLVLPDMIVTAPIPSAFSLSDLLEPPTVYVLVIAIALAAYILEKESK